MAQSWHGGRSPFRAKTQNRDLAVAALSRVSVDSEGRASDESDGEQYAGSPHSAPSDKEQVGAHHHHNSGHHHGQRSQTFQQDSGRLLHFAGLSSSSSSSDSEKKGENRALLGAHTQQDSGRKSSARPASELGPERGPLVDPEAASEVWASMPATVSLPGCGSSEGCTLTTTQQRKNKAFIYLLFCIIAIEFVTSIVTTKFVASLGQDVLNARASVDNAFAWAQFVETVLVSGLTSRVASARVQGRTEDMRQYITAGLAAAVLYGLVAAVALFAARPIVFDATGLTASEIAAGQGYYYAQAAFLPFTYAVFACSGIIFGLFDLPVYVGVVGVGAVLQVTGVALLIKVFGFGLAADAVMSGVASALVSGLCVVYFASGRFSRKFGVSLLRRPHGSPWISRPILLGFGIDNGHLFAYDAVSSMSQLLLLPLTARISKDAETGMFIMVSVLSLPSGVAGGFRMAINMIGSILVARGVYVRLRKFMQMMFLQMLALFAIFGAVVVIWPAPVSSFLVGSDASSAVLDTIKLAWFIFALAMPLLALQSVMEGIMFATLRFSTVSAVGVTSFLGVFVPVVVVGVWQQSVVWCFSAWAAFTAVRSAVFLAIYLLRIWPEHKRERQRILDRIARHAQVYARGGN